MAIGRAAGALALGGPRRLLAVLPIVCAGYVAWPAPALAVAKDAEAQQLADEAIFTDYLKLDFKSAEKKLLRAIKLCGKSNCSPTVTAQVHRDLAVIYITGLKRLADGKKLLIKALTYDPRIALDADLTTPELVRAFSEAKEEVTKQEQEEAAPEDTPPEEEPPPAPAPKKRAATADAEEKPAPPEPEPEPEPVRRGSVDCPPDFPGCESVDESPEEPDAKSDDKHIRNWLSVSLQQDFLMFGGESGVCGPGGPEQLSCFRANDDFLGSDEPLAPNGRGEVSGGFGIATTRLLIGYDRLLTNNITAGARVGYAIGGGPAEPQGAAFLPFHAEARGAYWFGVDPFSKRELRPFANVAFGLAQVDSSVTTEVIDQDSATAPQRYEVSRVSVWRKTGTLFGSIGGGAMYPLFDNGGIIGELRAMILLPSAGTSLALQAGYAHGF